MSNQMNKINRKIQEYIDNYQPEIKANCGGHAGINRLKRNQAKRLARKLRGK